MYDTVRITIIVSSISTIIHSGNPTRPLRMDGGMPHVWLDITRNDIVHTHCLYILKALEYAARTK